MYIDVWGPAKVASFGGRQYFINDYSHQVWVKGTADLKFDVRFRFVCEFFKERYTFLQKIGTAKVPSHKFKFCLDLFGICNLDWPLGALEETTKKFQFGRLDGIQAKVEIC